MEEKTKKRTPSAKKSPALSGKEAKKIPSMENERQEDSKEVSPRAEEVQLLKKALEEKTREAASHYEQLLRARAEFENSMKRQAKERSRFVKFSNENLIRSLLPAISNLERANNAAKESSEGLESLRVGVEMILKMFYSALKEAGVEPIESVGLPFDPARHEVISCVESADHEEGTIINEFEKGYFLNDRLLCPAKVVVSKKPAQT